MKSVNDSYKAQLEEKDRLIAAQTLEIMQLKQRLRMKVKESRDQPMAVEQPGRPGGSAI